jgi:creatinine amidohydrolase/Fe(II)-dependent formamide hydrolase-like protein
MTPDPNGPNPDRRPPDPVHRGDDLDGSARRAQGGQRTRSSSPPGGVEQNGPYLATGKHNVILRRPRQGDRPKLGNTLIAPIVAFVPEGEIDPPTDHMKYPGTISLTEATVPGAASPTSARASGTHGSSSCLLIGDSGGNQAGMKKGRRRPQRPVGPTARTRVHYIPEYYEDESLDQWLEDQGIKEIDEGFHDSFEMEAQMLLVDPTTVRMKERIAAGQVPDQRRRPGAGGEDRRVGPEDRELQADLTVAAIRKSLAH